MRRAILALVVAGLLPGLLRADTSLPVKTLTDLKEATVFIRVEKDKVAAASGSGFLIHVDGDTGYVVTNHHVVHLTIKVERRVIPIGPHHIGPGRPIRPGMEPRTEIVEIAVPAPNITLTFGSGTKHERTLKAEVVAADPEADLAVVKVTGLKDPPRPLNLQPPEVVETMTVFLLGYPFGKKLALDEGNPAITVSRAAVSAIRTSKGGDLKVIQFDGEVNPGNSGGPVVNENGQLVGVVVAKIRNTNIGMAIPAQELQRLLVGRAAQPELVPVKAEKGTVEVKVEVNLLDPLERIKSLELYYVPTSAVTDEARKHGLSGLAESKKVELKRERLKALGTFSVTVPEKGALDLTCQVVYVNGDGKTVLTDLKPSTLGAIVSPVQPNPTKPDTTPRVEEKFDAAALKAALKPSQPGDRGSLVGVTLPPLTKGKPLTADELTAVIADLQVKDRAPAAIKRLLNTEPDVKRQAEVARLLEQCAANKDLNVFARADAASALRWWGTAESVPALAALLGDPDVHSIHYRHPAMWSLAYLGGDKAITALAGRLETFLDRGAVSKMLQQMGSATEPQALALLEHKDAPIRVEATNVLKSVGTKAAAPALFQAAEKDENEAVRQGARAALQAIAARQKNP